MFDEFRHMKVINTIFFDKNKFGNEHFEVDCQSSDKFDKLPDMRDINTRSVERTVDKNKYV